MKAKAFLESAANIAIIILAIAVGCTWFWKYRPFSAHPQIASRALRLGQTIELPQSAFESGRKTIVMVLSTSCHFCSESTPFYQQMIRRAAEQGDSVIAVFPQDKDSAQAYLSGKQLKVDTLVQKDLSAIDVNGTPTLILSDPGRHVLRVWVGKLDTYGEKQVIASI